MCVLFHIVPTLHYFITVPFSQRILFYLKQVWDVQEYHSKILFQTLDGRQYFIFTRPQPFGFLADFFNYHTMHVLQVLF